MNEIMKGVAFLAICMIGIPVIPCATYRLRPTGGVTKAMARFITIMTPKCIGFMPKLLTTGSRIGVRIKIAGVVSITIPTKRSSTFIIRSKTILLELS